MDHDPQYDEPASTLLDDLDDSELAALHADLDPAEEGLDRVGCVPYVDVSASLDKFCVEFEAERRKKATPSLAQTCSRNDG